MPALTRGAQNHQKGLEIKSDLVKSMSSAASPFLAATFASELVYHGKPPRSYDVAYQRWVTADNEVFTQLRTYFPDADATQDWSTFSFRMRDLYYFFRLPVTGTRGYRAFYLDHLKPWVEESCRPTCGPPADWGRLEQWLAQPSGRFDPDVSNSLSALFYAFRGRLNAIVNETLAAKAHL